MAKILVVEDDPTIRHCYRKMFKDHEVQILESKPNMREIRKADLVISDFLGMGFKDTKLKCDKISKPLVLVSASAEPGTHQHQFGKPFNLEELVSTVGKLIR